jgi:F-type H+-transporting ATPase subunit b
MEINWTTFALEIVNFLVLMWILQRVLYRPVMGAIVRRREASERLIGDARAQSLAAEQLKKDYERRAADQQAERDRALSMLASEVEAERARQLQAMQTGLAEERDRQRAFERQRLHDVERRAERAARERAASFCARLFVRLANPALDAAICAAMLEDLARLGPDLRRRVAAAADDDAAVVAFTSARPLGEAQRRALVDALVQILGRTPRSFEFHEDATLIAGLAVDIGAWVLRANLRDELGFFAEVERDGA